MTELSSLTIGTIKNEHSRSKSPSFSNLQLTDSRTKPTSLKHRVARLWLRLYVSNSSITARSQLKRETS